MQKFIDRRLFCLGALSGLYTTANAQVSLLTPRLLVVRRPSIIPSTNCLAPCIRGSVYDVTNMGSFNNIVLDSLVLDPPICDVIERPWQNNAPNVSSIKVGVYKTKVRDSVGTNSNGTPKKWMTRSYDHRWRIELVGTAPARTYIQFHYGRDVSWSEGCFIVGRHVSQDPAGLVKGYCRVYDSLNAIRALRTTITAPGRDYRKTEVAVTDYSSLFPQFKTTKC